MIINTKGITTENPNEWLTPTKNADGTYQTITHASKIVAWNEEYSTKGDHMVVIEFRTSSNKKFTEKFIISDSEQLWRLKRLEVALKAPESYSLDSFVGRYIVAVMSGRAGTKGGDFNRIEEWQYAKQNDALPPIPEAKDENAALDEEADLAF